MAGIGAESAYGNVGGYQGLQDWMRQKRQQVVEGQQDTLFQQGQEDRTAGLAQEQEVARQKMLAAQQEAQQKAEYKARVKELGLPKLAEIGAMISIDRGQMPQGLIDALKPKDPTAVDTVDANGNPVKRWITPEAGMEVPAYVAPKTPHYQIAPSGKPYDPTDPSTLTRTDLGPVKAGPSEASQLAAEMARLRIDAEKQKQADAAAGKVRDADAGRQSAADAVATIDRLLAHPGLASSTGAYEMRGWTQPARDFRAELNRFVAQQTKGNLGSLKGPMSDKDIAFIKQMSTTAADTNLSDEALIAELKRARAAYTGENGGAAPLTRTQRNKRTGETRTQTSTDGGLTWH